MQALRNRLHFLNALEHLCCLLKQQAARVGEPQRTASALD
jgi:hypothetical protein